MSHVLRLHRERAGLSQVELARKSSVSQSEIAKIEACRTYLGPVRAGRLARALKISLSVLL